MDDHESSCAFLVHDTTRLIRRRFQWAIRDLGITEATDGFMRSQVMIGSQGMTKPTGWHYHTCEMQFVYVLKMSSLVSVVGLQELTRRANELTRQTRIH